MLDKYIRVSRQILNLEKQKILFFNTKMAIQRRIANYLSFQIANLSSKYLRAAMFGGANKTQLWEETISECRLKAYSCKNKRLTLAGRITMIKILNMSCLLFLSL